MNTYETDHLTVTEATAMASIGRTKLYELLSSGKVTGVKLGRRTLVHAQSLRDFLDELPRFRGATK